MLRSLRIGELHRQELPGLGMENPESSMLLGVLGLRLVFGASRRGLFCMYVRSGVPGTHVVEVLELDSILP